RKELDVDKLSSVGLSVESFNRIAKLAQDAVRHYTELASVKDGISHLTERHVAEQISKETNIESGQLLQGKRDNSRYLQMEAELGKSVVNQENAIHALAEAIRINRAGIAEPNTPIGRFIFAGTTGVGKTYMVEKLAEFLFEDSTAMTRIDLSE